MTYGYTTTVPTEDHSDKTVWACRALVWTSVLIAALGFGSKGVLPTVILSVVMVATVTLLSYSLGRLVLAFKARKWRLFAQTLVLAAVFVGVEAQLNHLGLVWLNDTYKLATADQISLAMWFLPLLNLFATDSFTTEIRLPKPPAQALADRTPVSEDPRPTHEINAANHDRMTKWEQDRRNDPERELYIGSAKDREVKEKALQKIRSVVLGQPAA